MGEAMKITPLDIHQKEFRRALRGYNEEEVDAFLDEVAKEMERLFQENIDLTERVERLEKKVAQYQSFEQALQETMLAAQKAATDLKLNAEKAAQLIIKDAQMKAEQIKRQTLLERDKVRAEIVFLRQIADEFKKNFLQFLKAQGETVATIENLANRLPSFGEFEEQLVKMSEGEPPPAPEGAAGGSPQNLAPPEISSLEETQPPISFVEGSGEGTPDEE
jgi:cell division initiation protein